MFTGIVEEIGMIRRMSRGPSSVKMAIKADRIMEDIHLGDSIAVNGVCLTVTGIDGMCFWADAMHETLARSSLAAAGIGQLVNLERAMAANGRFGGHIVSGHIDGIGKITRIRRDDIAVVYTICTAPSILQLIVEKGSVAVDGISLTVTAVSGQDFGVSVIPHTVRQTILGEKQVGSTVNLENDVIGKYVEKLFPRATSQVDMLACPFDDREGPIPRCLQQGMKLGGLSGNADATKLTRTFLMENGF